MPIATTAAAAALAMVPLVIMGARPGHELVHPLAMVVLGGLVTSTLHSLFVLPALYLRFGPSAALEPEATHAEELIADLAPRVERPAPSAVAMKPPDVQPEPST